MLPTSTRTFFSAAWSRLAIFKHPAWALALLVIVPVSLKFQPGPATRTIQVMAVLAAIVSLIQQLAACRWPRRRPAIKRVARLARRARSALALAWDVEILHVSVLLLFFVLLLLFVCRPESMRGAPWWLFPPGLVFVLAGAIDAIRITVAMAKFAWARWTGKMYLAGLAAFSVWAGEVFAQKTIARATGLDPKHFETTERLIHLIATPVIAAAVSIGVLLVLGFLAYFVVMTFSMAQQPLQILRLGFGQLIPGRAKSSVAYRMIHGKNRMRGALDRKRFFDDAIPWMRPVSICAFCCVVLAVLGQLQSLPASTVDPIVRTLVVGIEFNEGQKCGAKVVAEPLDHLEEGKAAVAIKNGADWRLEPDVCEAEKRSPHEAAK